MRTSSFSWVSAGDVAGGGFDDGSTTRGPESVVGCTGLCGGCGEELEIFNAMALLSFRKGRHMAQEPLACWHNHFEVSAASVRSVLQSHHGLWNSRVKDFTKSNESSVLPFLIMSAVSVMFVRPMRSSITTSLSTTSICRRCPSTARMVATS
jgi:hypothetical protein